MHQRNHEHILDRPKLSSLKVWQAVGLAASIAPTQRFARPVLFFSRRRLFLQFTTVIVIIVVVVVVVVVVVNREIAFFQQ